MASAAANTAYNALDEAFVAEQRQHQRHQSEHSVASTSARTLEDFARAERHDGGQVQSQSQSQLQQKAQHQEERDDAAELTPTGRKPVSRSKKAVAAVTGAIFTSMLMTPFDVVKTRLQMQAPPEPLFVPSQRLPPPTRAVAGGGASGGAVGAGSGAGAQAAPSEKALGKQRAVPSPSPSTSTSGSGAAARSSASASASASVLTGRAAAAGASAPATCCQPTFFLDNARHDSLACRYDPRLDRATASLQGLRAGGGSSTSGSGSGSHAPSSSGGKHARAARLSSVFSGGSSASASGAGATSSLPRHMKAASTCAFPDRAIAQRVLRSASSAPGGPLAFLGAAAATLPAPGAAAAAASPAAGAAAGPAAQWARLSQALLQGGGRLRRAGPSSLSASSAAGAAGGASAPGARLTGLWDGFLKVGRAEGARGLWRGLTPTIVMTIPSQVTYMSCYDFFRAYFLSFEDESQAAARRRAAAAAAGAGAGADGAAAKPRGPSLDAVNSHTLLASLGAGALSRAISATLVTPLELVRTRLQASSSLSASNSLGATLAALRREVRVRGAAPVLWRGLGTTLWRDVPFSAIYFAGYEAMKRALTGGGLGEGHAKGQREEFAVAFVSGAVSGSVAALATHPFDLIKTRLQAQAAQGGGSGSGSAGAGAARSASPHTAALLRHIYRTEGVAGLFRGFSPRVAKVAPACGVMIASFEVVGRFLADL